MNARSWVLGALTLTLTACTQASGSAAGVAPGASPMPTGVPSAAASPSPAANPSPTTSSSPMVSPSPAASPSPGGGVSFKLQVAPVVEAKCARCHGEGGRSPKLVDAQGQATFAVVSPRKGQAWSEIAAKQMPPAQVPQLTEAERADFKAWVDAGGPNN